MQKSSYFLIKATEATQIKGFSDDFCWLSNFHEIEPFDYEGLIYHTVENFYQAMKSTNLVERKIISNFTPGKSKRHTQKKSFILREDWDFIKENIMRQALIIKFNQSQMKDLPRIKRKAPSFTWGR